MVSYGQDHSDLAKVPFPDLDKDEPILDRYILKAPPTGDILGSFNAFQLGFLWKLPNVDDTDMLKSTKPDSFVEEKVYFEKNFEKDEKVAVPMKMALFKTWRSKDLHLRAIYTVDDDDLADDEPGALNYLRSKHQILGASVVNSEGKILIDEKLTRSYMCIGQRNWDIPSILTVKDFKSGGLLSEDGSLILRITFGNKTRLPAEYYSGVPVRASSSTAAVEDLANNDSIASNKKESLLNIVGLDSLRLQLSNFSKNEKFTDGIINIFDEVTEQVVEFPVHRVVLAAKSPYFEEQFELSQRITIEKYSAKCVQNILEYIYTGHVRSQDFNLLFQLIQAAEQFSISGLKHRCINNLAKCPINVRQAMDTFRLGQKENSVVLRVHAAEHLNKHKGHLESYEPEFKEFMLETGSEVLFDWLLRKD